MSLLRSRTKLIAALAIATLLALLLWRPVRQSLHVAALQKSTDGIVRIESGDHPTYLPSSVNRWIETLRRRHLPPEIEVDRHLERFRTLFRGPIHEIHVFYIENFTGDFGGALLKFKHLRELDFDLEPGTPRLTEAQLQEFCAHLHSLPHLEALALKGKPITDAVVTRLARHPTIKSLSLYHTSLTPRCMDTFSTIPSLKELKFGIDDPPPLNLFTREQEKAMAASLPGVRVKFE